MEPGVQEGRGPVGPMDVSTRSMDIPTRLVDTPASSRISERAEKEKASLPMRPADTKRIYPAFGSVGDYVRGRIGTESRMRLKGV